MKSAATERRGPDFDRQDAFLALLLFALAFGVRFHFRSAGLFHLDAVLDAVAAESALKDGRLHYLQGLGYPGESLLMTLTYAAFRLFGATSAGPAVIFASVLFGALGVPMLYLLARRLFDSRRTATYAAALLAFLPVHLSLSTFGKGHGMELFFLLLSAYLAVLAGERQTSATKLAAGVTLGFAMAIRHTSALILPAYLLLFWWASRPASRERWKGGREFLPERSRAGMVRDAALLVVPAFAVFLLSFLPRMFYDHSYSLLDSVRGNIGEAAPGLGMLWPLLEKSISWATVSLTPLGWLLAAAGAIVLWRRDRLLATALLAWFAIFFVFLSDVSILSPRFVIPALAVPVMLAAVAVESIGGPGRFGARQAGAMAVLIGLCAWMMANIYPVLEYRRHHCGPCDFARAAGRAIEPTAAILATDDGFHDGYYARRRVLERPMDLELLQEGKLAASLAQIDSLLRAGTAVYVTTLGLGYDLPLPLKFDPTTLVIESAAEGKVYAHLRFDAPRKAIYDAETGVRFFEAGLYAIELLDRFRLEPVLQAENEDWHHSCVENVLYTSTLYRIRRRGG